MFKLNRLMLCALVPVAIVACDSGTVSTSQGIDAQGVGDTGVESAAADAVNLDIGGSDFVYAPFCQEEPFASETTGTFKGVIANEIFSEFSRCEFDITLKVEGAGADNQFCEQTGVLSFTGTQTVSSDFPSVCGSVEDQAVTIGWNLQESSEPTEDGTQVQLTSALKYPLEAVVSSWGIEQFPEADDQGVQIEYPVVLFSLQLNEDLTISGGDADLYSGVLQKIE